MFSFLHAPLSRQVLGAHGLLGFALCLPGFALCLLGFARCLLGIDHRLDRGRIFPVRKHRFDKLRRRLKFMRKLNTQRTSTARVFYTGALPAATFGMETSLLASKEIQFLRTQGAQSLRIPRGVKPGYAWAGQRLGADPRLLALRLLWSGMRGRFGLLLLLMLRATMGTS